MFSFQQGAHCKGYSSNLYDGSLISYVRKLFRKFNISYHLTGRRTCVHQGMRNTSFAYVLSEWSLYIIIFFVNKDFRDYRGSRLEVFCKKGVLKNFSKFTGKNSCQSLFFNKVTKTLLKTRIWHWCFLVNFTKFFRTAFLQTTSRRLLLSFNLFAENLVTR